MTKKTNFLFIEIYNIKIQDYLSVIFSIETLGASLKLYNTWMNISCEHKVLVCQVQKRIVIKQTGWMI